MLKNLTQALLAILFVTSSVVAQTNQEEIANLEGFIKNMYEGHFSSSNSSISESEFEALFDKRFKGTEVDVRGEVQIRTTDLGTMKEDYQRFKNNRKSALRFAIKEFHTVSIKGKTGVASMTLEFQLMMDNEPISKGEQAISMTLRKFEDTWKITFINRLFVESEKYVGNCICELFSEGGANKDGMGKYATYLTMPDGDEYMEANDRFTITAKGANREITRNGDDSYEWNIKSGDIVKNGEVIGNAKVPSTAIKNVLKYVNSDRCQRVTNKK